jgi:uncharacterized protein (DUF488 family)
MPLSARDNGPLPSGRRAVDSLDERFHSQRPHWHNSGMPASPGLVSIGYEGRTAEDLVAALLAANVGVVADVRLTPLSRKPGLSKRRLAEALNAAGIEYIHLRALGNPRDNREPFRNGRSAAGVDRFRELMQDSDSARWLDELAEMARRQKVAVLCFERDHDRCHRQVVTEEVIRRAANTAVAYA